MSPTPYVGQAANARESDNECFVKNESVGRTPQNRKVWWADPVECARAGVRHPRVAWYRQRSIVERFWSKVDKNGPVHPALGTRCWLWTGSVAPVYGQIHLGHPYTPGSKHWKTHRFSWELHHGPIPDGCVVLHRCDIPRCVNPEHLSIGTQKDNIHDCLYKGRRFGVRKLTADDVRVIRLQSARGISVKDIASAFSVTDSNIRQILRRESWAWVD